MNQTALGALCAFSSSVTWALGSTVYSRLARKHTAFAVNLGRSLFALPLFVILALALGGGIDAFSGVRLEHLGWFFLSMVASYGVGDMIFLMATHSLGVPGAMAIASCYPIWTALAGWLIEGQGLALSQIAGLLVTVGGVVAVILIPSAPVASAVGSEGTGIPAGVVGTRGQARARNRGILLAVITSLFWATNGFSVFRAGQGLSMPVANTIRMGLAVVFSFILGRILFPGTPAAPPARVFVRWWWVFVVEAFAGSALFVYGLAHSPLAIGSTLSSLAPVLSVPIAVMTGAERFSPGRTAAVVAVVIGLRFLVSG